MERYNNIRYSFKQAKNMLETHKGFLQMGLPEWDKGDSIRLYTKPNVTSAIYKAEREINPELPIESLYLPDDMYQVLQSLGKYTEQYLGDLITEKYLYKHSVRQTSYGVYVNNSIYIPTSGEIRRKDWILYKL